MHSVAIALLGIVLVTSCGRQSDTEYGEDPGGSVDAEFLALKPKIDESCGGCHNGVTHPLKFTGPASFRTAKVKRRIEEGSMPPPPRKLSDERKQEFLAYLSR